MITLKFFLVFAIAGLSLGENIFYDKLEKLLDYCLIHEDSVDSGTLLGVSFAKGQLLSEKGVLGIDKIMAKLDKLQSLFNKSGKTFMIENDLDYGNEFVNSSLFTGGFFLRFGEMNQAANLFQSTKSYLEVVNDPRNMPNGFYSDFCLAEVLKSCEISEPCWKIEDIRKSSFGFSQTHKLLFHLFNHLTCKTRTFAQISNKICNNIYQETHFIVDKTIVVPEFKDLLMEQIFLCSFVGFSEFMNNRWVSQLISWQMDSGCFSYDEILCSSHMNGIGAASLALFGKTLSHM